MRQVYSHTTNRLKVTVTPEYQNALSISEDDHYVWTYDIMVENQSTETVQILSRFWQIIDSQGRIQEVRGKGVVGKQPILKPKARFQYMSQVHLQTSSGIMLGTYLIMNHKSDEQYEIIVPTFSLDNPLEVVTFN
jgi:ApaG protein